MKATNVQGVRIDSFSTIVLLDDVAEKQMAGSKATASIALAALDVWIMGGNDVIKPFRATRAMRLPLCCWF